MPLTLKGTQQGIVMKPLAASWDTVLSGLENALEEAQAFFRGGRVILDMGDGELAHEELVALRAALDQHEMELWAVLSNNEDTVRTARSYGLRTRLPGETPRSERAVPDRPEANALYVQRTLRSGQSVKFAGHVILFGDVNPGAEVIAGGNIIVWGRVRGMVHAGAFGDEDAIVCALSLNPAQLRIAGAISRAPQEIGRMSEPEVARIANNTIIAEPWTTRE